MSKHLYYFNWQLQTMIWGVVIDDLISTTGNEDDVYFLSCRGCLVPCWSNPTGLKSQCELCRLSHKAAFTNINRKVHQLYIDDYVDDIVINKLFKEQQYNYQSFDDIKKITYKGMAIGYGALSTYVSLTRNREPVIDDAFKLYFDGLLKSQIKIKEAIDQIIDNIKPDTISIFNGRIHDTRPVYETAIQKGIHLRGIESVLKGPYEIQKRIFDNALPHSIEWQTNAIQNLWKQSPRSLEEKMAIAGSFFEGRRSAKLTRDVQVYTAGQQNGLMPEGWNPAFHNIVIFNSSEDEFAAIGDEFDSLALFPTQETGIEYLLSNTNDPNIHFYLRVHPNLRTVNYGYHNRLYQLPEKFNNITVIDANSPISTYALIDYADKIVVFGSTTGVEASYSGKPVILLGGAFYYNLDVAYIPKNKEHLAALISSENKLLPKQPLGALMYGFYLMDYDAYTVPISLNAQPINIGNKTLGYSLPHLKVWGSPILFKMVTLLLRAKNNLLNLLKKEKALIIPTQGK